MSGRLAIVVAGAGRMGQAIAAIANERNDTRLAGIWQRGQDLDALLEDADVLIDFSLPTAIDRVVDAARKAGVPLVCGVTGLDDAQMARVESLGSDVPVVYDRNMSRGIAVLDAALRQVAGALPADYQIDVSEVHHVHKKDAPSGTALKLGEALAAARGIGLADIRISSERRGEVPGDHSVSFSSGSERLTLSHSVTSRRVFAEGAVSAAQWIIGRPPGRYSMQDVLFEA